MLEEVLTKICNWFRVKDSADGIHPGTFAIKGGRIDLPFLKDGQYFRIIGSVFNDGLHQYHAPPAEDTPPVAEETDAAEGLEPEGTEEPKESDLTDETFDGKIWALAIPREIIKIAAEMAEWQEKYGAKAAGVYQSESFGGYSYSMFTNGHGGQLSVWDRYRDRLKPYQKLREF